MVVLVFLKECSLKCCKYCSQFNTNSSDFQRASVHFFQYFCECGQYLFNNGDIMNSTKLFDRTYIFVEYFENLQQNVHILRGNVVMCLKCNRCLGGAIYRGFIGQTDVFRFCGHQIFRKKTYLDEYRIINIDENLQSLNTNELQKYHTELNCTSAERVAEL